MASLLRQNSWVLLVRGLAAVVFGIAALVWPALTVATLVMLFGVYVLVDGISDVVGAVLCRKNNRDWWIILLTGLAGIAVGIITFIQPGITALSLLFLIAAWALVMGVLMIVIAIQLRREIEGEWVLILDGVISVLFGLVAFASPRTGALSLIWLIGVVAIVIGVLTVVLSFRVRRWAKQLAPDAG